MGAEPVFQEPDILLPVHEAEIRRDFAIKIESEINANPGISNFKLNATQVAIILSVPLFTLQPCGYLSPSGGYLEELRRRLAGLLPLLKHFLRPEASKLPKMKQPPPCKTWYVDDESLPPDAKRSESEERKCSERDKHTCVVMSTGEPRVCHIVPYTWSETQANIRKTFKVFRHAEAFCGIDWRLTYWLYICNPHRPGGSDKVWNMLCLDNQLYQWWSDARFGFKCLGIRPTTEDEQSVVTFQFNWMPRRNMNPTKRMELQGPDNGFDEMVEYAKSFHRGGSLPPIYGLSGLPILSGHLIHIPMPSSEAVDFKAMIDFQWAMIVVAAFCGAAGAPELLPDHQDSYYNDQDVYDDPEDVYDP